MKKVEDYVRSIPDFPEKGIIFRDITTVIQSPEGLKLAIDGINEKLKGVDYDVLKGSAIAYMNANVLVQKENLQGKVEQISAHDGI